MLFFKCCFQFTLYHPIHVLYLRLFTIKDILTTIKSLAWLDFKCRKPFESLREIMHVALVFRNNKKSDACRFRKIYTRRSNTISIHCIFNWTLFRIATWQGDGKLIHPHLCPKVNMILRGVFCKNGFKKLSYD